LTGEKTAIPFEFVRLRSREGEPIFICEPHRVAPPAQIPYAAANARIGNRRKTWRPGAFAAAGGGRGPA
jgi:hypothetical protein